MSKPHPQADSHSDEDPQPSPALEPNSNGENGADAEELSEETEPTPELRAIGKPKKKSKAEMQLEAERMAERKAQRQAELAAKRAAWKAAEEAKANPSAAPSGVGNEQKVESEAKAKLEAEAKLDEAARRDAEKLQAAMAKLQAENQRPARTELTPALTPAPLPAAKGEAPAVLEPTPPAKPAPIAEPPRAAQAASAPKPAPKNPSARSAPAAKPASPERPPSKAAAPANAQAKGRFSLEQTREMMQVEFERANRQRYPLVCFVIGVDDFSDLVEVYGEQRKAEIMQAAFGLLKRITQASKLQGIGCWTKERLLAIFPHTAKNVASRVAEQIVQGARELKFERGSDTQHVTLSIGVSRNMHEDTKTLEALIRAAERGLAMASEVGGDRFVHWVEVESELEKIRGELAEQTRLLRASSAGAGAEAKAEQTEFEKTLLLQLREVFAVADKNDPDLAGLEEEVLALFEHGLSDSRKRLLEQTMAEHTMQMDMLERRIAKLNKTLGMTESELKRVASMKMIDSGIASIYGSVQGISGDDDQAELKKELMADIFQANLALKEVIEQRKAPAA